MSPLGEEIKRPKYKKISVVLNYDQAKIIKDKSEQTELSMSEVIKRALKDYFMTENF